MSSRAVGLRHLRLFCPQGSPPGHWVLDSRVVCTSHFLVVVMPGAASFSLPAKKSCASTAQRILERGDPGSLLVVPLTPPFTDAEARSPVPKTSAHWSLPYPLIASSQDLSTRTAGCLVLGQSGWMELQGPSHTRLGVPPFIFKTESWGNEQDLNMWGQPPGMVRERLMNCHLPSSCLPGLSQGPPSPVSGLPGASLLLSLLYSLLKYTMSLSA